MKRFRKQFRRYKASNFCLLWQFAAFFHWTYFFINQVNDMNGDAQYFEILTVPLRCQIGAKSLFLVSKCIIEKIANIKTEWNHWSWNVLFFKLFEYLQIFYEINRLTISIHSCTSFTLSQRVVYLLRAFQPDKACCNVLYRSLSVCHSRE